MQWQYLCEKVPLYIIQCCGENLQTGVILLSII